MPAPNWAEAEAPVNKKASSNKQISREIPARIVNLLISNHGLLKGLSSARMFVTPVHGTCQAPGLARGPDVARRLRRNDCHLPAFGLDSGLCPPRNGTNLSPDNALKRRRNLRCAFWRSSWT